MEEWFVINDIHEFTDKVRAIVYNNFGSLDKNKEIDIIIDDIKDEDKNEFDKMLSHKESLTIIKENIKKEKSKKTKKIRYILNEKIFTQIVTSLNDRMVSNVMNSLVQKGLVESAFDNESNDFIFWVSDDENKKQKEKPETD